MQWDNRLTDLGVHVTPTPNARWIISAAQYQNENEAQGQHHVWSTVLDERGKPKADVPVFVDWVGRDPDDHPTRRLTDVNGRANIDIYANLDTTKKNGPYFAYVERQAASDVVRGMGLPEKHHVNFLLTYSMPPSQPAQTLEEAILAQAQSVPWMPVNNRAALWNFAKASGLQDQQTDELTVIYDGQEYVLQVFNLGIVYCKKGDWANIKVIRK